MAVALWAGALPVARGADTPSEPSVKAAYLYKFLAYVEWPATAFAGPESPHVIAVLDAEPVLAALQQIAASRSASPGIRPLVVRRVSAGDALDGVHLLHVGRAGRAAYTAWLRRPWLLVVTDAPDGLPAYASLNFIVVDRRVRFEASQLAAERAGLRLSARLLAVAERVVAP
jgi:hypothetical protein